jgi:tetratricopeptide (TPR) repeat protein
MKLLKIIFVVAALGIFLPACNSYNKALRKHNQLSDRQKLDLSTILIEATRYRILGDASSAITLYSKIIELDPLHDAALFELAKLKLVTGETDKAAELMKLAIKKEPQNIWYALGYATALSQSGKYNEAAVEYKAIRLKNPDNYNLYGYEAQCYENINNFQKAIDVYNELEKMVGINEESGIRKYLIYMNWGKSDKAMAEVQKLATTFPENSEYSLAMAEYYMRAGKMGLAYQSINAVLLSDPNSVGARSYLADYHHFSGNDEQAKQEISTLIANPNVSVDDKIGVLMNIYKSGSIYGDTLAAYPMLDTLTIIHPSDAKVWAMYADFLNYEDRIEEAIEKWKQALALDSSHFTIWEVVLGAMDQMQQTDTLLLYSKRTVELFPEQALGWMYYGTSLAATEQYAEAIDPLETALDLKIANKQARNKTFFALAEAYSKTKQFDQSDAMFEQLIKADSNNTVAINSYAYSLALRNQNIEKAALLAKMLPTGSADNYEFLHTQGLVLFRQGKYNEAIAHFEEAMHIGGEKNGALLEHYADALFLLNRTDEAVRYWQQAREMGGTSSSIDKKIKDKKYYE